MFGSILDWAFASTQAVAAKMPTLAIAIRARFIVYLPFFKQSGKSNVRVKANVPNDTRKTFSLIASVATPEGVRRIRSPTRTPPESVAVERRLPGRGLWEPQ